MPLLLKRLSSKGKSKGQSKTMKSQKSSIFRRRKSGESKMQQEQEGIHPNLTWPSSYDSEEPSPVSSPSGSSSVGSASSEIESLKQNHSEDVEQMTAEITALEKSKEALKLEKEASEQVMLQQESDIVEKDLEIKSLRDALAKSAKIHSDSSSTTKVVERTIDPEEIWGNDYQRKYEAAQTIIYHQEIDIVTKADEISFLQSTLQTQEARHDYQMKVLLHKLVEREQEIVSLKEKVTVTSELVSQTASMLLKYHK